jgi:magnesium chelatase family protein
MEAPDRALAELAHAPSSASVRARVLAAREMQAARNGPGRCNGRLRTLDPGRLEFGGDAREQLRSELAVDVPSGRRQRAIVLVSRTLADLAGMEQVDAGMVACAAQFCRGAGPERLDG